MEIGEREITLLRRDESGQSVLLGGGLIPDGGHQYGLVGYLNSERSISRCQFLLILKSSDLCIQSSDLPLQFSDASYDFFLRSHSFPIFTDLQKF